MSTFISGTTILEYILFPPKSLNREKLKRSIKNKTILVTGASYGIGECVADLLACNEVRLILVARTKEKLESLKSRFEKKGAEVYIFSADLYKKEEVESLLVYIAKLPFTVDIFINNAGKSIHRSIEDSLLRFHDFSRTMSLNYFAPVLLVLGLIPGLTRAKGRIINVSALNVLLCPAPGWAAYQASKAAFDNWFRCALPELNNKGIVCTSVYLPLVRTRMISPTRIYDNAPAMRPEYAACVICNTIYKNKSKYSPWWSTIPEILSLLFRRQWEKLSSYLIYRGK